MNKIVNIPNLISFSRIAMVPIIFFLIINVTDQLYPILLIVYALTVSLDFFDGYVARKFAMVTELGKILDPLADKILTFFAIIALCIKTDFPLWIAIPIVIRDIMILLASSWLYRRKHLVKSSISLGKITFFMITCLIYIYLVGLNRLIDLSILKQYFSVLCLSFLVWSFREYFLVYKRVKKDD